MTRSALENDSLPVSSSLLSRKMTGLRQPPASASTRSAVSAITTPAFMSSTPGPHGPASAHPEGHFLSVPSGQTVSRWPSSIRGVPRAGPKRPTSRSPADFCLLRLLLPPAALIHFSSNGDAAVYGRPVFGRGFDLNQFGHHFQHLWTSPGHGAGQLTVGLHGPLFFRSSTVVVGPPAPISLWHF